MIKTNYYHQRRQKLYQSVAGFGVAFLLIYFLSGSLLRPSADWVSLALRPAWWASESLASGARVVGDFFANQNRLAIENRRLKEENEKFRSLLLAKSQVENDNRYLRGVFGRTDKKTKPLIGQVIFLPNFIPQQTLLIDLGKENAAKNFSVGDLAVTSGQVLVGRVAEIDNWTAKVRLLSAEKELAVNIGPQNIPAIAEGMGAGNYGIVLPKDTQINVGDRVTIPFFDRRLIGTVRAVSKNPSQPNQVVLVKAPVNLWQLKWLEFYDFQS